jgi:uncharacterized membrane protein YcaP (DUF421 family)
MMDFLRIGFELFVGFIALFIITKILGKTQITQITPFDFISALVLGELVGNAVFDHEVGLLEILFAVFLWGILIFIIEMVTQKLAKTREILEGKPSIVIRNGKIDYQQLKKNKLDINQLQHLLRVKNVFSIREAEFAILETDGSISVLKKPVYETPTRKDYNMLVKPVTLPVTLISDGELFEDNVREIGYNKDWILTQIRMYGAKQIEDVLYADWKEGEGIHVQLK